MDIQDYKTPANLKEYRLGGVKGYSLHVYGTKNRREGVCYETIELRYRFTRYGGHAWMLHTPYTPPLKPNPKLEDLLQNPEEELSTDDRAFLTSLYNEARKHLAMGSV